MRDFFYKKHENEKFYAFLRLVQISLIYLFHVQFSFNKILRDLGIQNE